MDADKYTRQIALQCPTCGGQDFEHEESFAEGAGTARCVRCGREFTKDELMAENGAIIEGEVEELGKEFVKDFAKDFRASLKRSLRGSRYIKLK